MAVEGDIIYSGRFLPRLIRVTTVLRKLGRLSKEGKNDELKNLLMANNCFKSLPYPERLWFRAMVLYTKWMPLLLCKMPQCMPGDCIATKLSTHKA